MAWSLPFIYSHSASFPGKPWIVIVYRVIPVSLTFIKILYKWVSKITWPWLPYNFHWATLDWFILWISVIEPIPRRECWHINLTRRACAFARSHHQGYTGRFDQSFSNYWKIWVHFTLWEDLMGLPNTADWKIRLMCWTERWTQTS